MSGSHSSAGLSPPRGGGLPFRVQTVPFWVVILLRLGHLLRVKAKDISLSVACPTCYVAPRRRCELSCGGFTPILTAVNENTLLQSLLPICPSCSGTSTATLDFWALYLHCPLGQLPKLAFCDNFEEMNLLETNAAALKDGILVRNDYLLQFRLDSWLMGAQEFHSYRHISTNRAFCMKTILKTILCILVLAGSVDAAKYTVKSGGGGNYTTIQACATAMAAGDSCTVFAGTYNEHVSLSAGGVGAYKTLQVNGTDLVYVYDFSINSHNKIIGFHIQNPSTPYGFNCVGIANAATDIYITNNAITECGLNAMIADPESTNGTSYVYIQGNTLSYACGTPAAPNVCYGIVVNGDHHLVENNDISHTFIGIVLLGAHNVVRKNNFHDVSTAECGSHSANCHIDFTTSEPTFGLNMPAQYNLIEGNTELNNSGSDGKGVLTQANTCQNGGTTQCFNMIVRFNTAAHFGSGNLTNNNGLNNTVPGFLYVKLYNNTWVDFNRTNPAFGQTDVYSNNSNYGANINDIFYYPQSLSSFNPYGTDSTTVGTFSSGHNLAYCTVSPCNLHGKVYGSGNFTDDPGNIKADPLFMNYSANNFNLQSSSPAIGAGTYLTTVASGDSGSGTSLVVNDAAYFQDGSGITGVQADCISVTVASKHVCVTAVNYSTNTLTLVSGILRSAGDPVWLYSDSTGRTVLIGSAPNIGASVDPASAPAPPTGLAALVN